MHENGRLYFEGNAGENAPANMKNAPAAIKTGVPAAAGLADRRSANTALDGGHPAKRPNRPVSHQLYLSPVFPTIPMCPPEADQQAEAPPANTSKTPRITLAVISLYHSLWALSIKSRKKPGAAARAGPLRYAYRLPGWRGMYVPMGPVFISPWSTASVPRR